MAKRRPRRSLWDDLAGLGKVVEQVAAVVEQVELPNADPIEPPLDLSQKYPNAIETRCVSLGVSPA